MTKSSPNKENAAMWKSLLCILSLILLPYASLSYAETEEDVSVEEDNTRVEDTSVEEEGIEDEIERANKKREQEEAEYQNRWFCEATPVYKDHGLFVDAPAAIGGCATEVMGLPYSLPVAAVEYLKRQMGDPRAEKMHFNQVSGIFNALGSGFFGSPFWITKRLFWDYPKRKLFPSNEDIQEDKEISVAQKAQ